MIKLTLKELKLLNFKGIRDLSIPITQETSIYGDNATGKTSIVDAYLWLLTGKDSSDRKDHEIKTLDSNNKPIQKLEHSVTGIFDFNGSTLEIRREYREKWVKKKGEAVPVFDGHETSFYWNEVPLSQGDYKVKLASVISEEVLKLISNPLFFNEGISWQDRRVILGKMAGDISPEEVLKLIATPENDYGTVINAINEGKSLVEYKKQVAAQKLKIKKDLEDIPTRIDELTRNKPEEVDVKALQLKEVELSKEVDKIDEQLEDLSKAHSQAYKNYEEKANELNGYKTKLAEIERNSNNTSEVEHTLKSEINNKEVGLRTLEAELQSLEDNLKIISNEKNNYYKRIEELELETSKAREQWVKVNSSELVIDDSATACPACKRVYEEDKVEDIKANLVKNFNEDKATKIKSITDKANTNKAEVLDYKKKIEERDLKVNELKTKKEDLTTRIAAVKSNIEEDKNRLLKIKEEVRPLPPEHGELLAKIEAFIMPEAPRVDSQDLKDLKNKFIEEIKQLSINISKAGEVDRINDRIKELSDKEALLSQDLANQERIEFDIDNYLRARIKLVTKKTNDLFKYVSFKMFEEQINGGINETCEALVNGVPFSALNNAAKINAGLDIINALSIYYGVSAPIFIDNRESINKLIPCPSQIVNLIVSADPKLRIENK